LELSLAIHIIACAILNPSRVLIFSSFIYLITFNAGQTEWDVSRFADKVKMTKPTNDGTEPKEDQTLDTYFKKAEFGEVSEPATILDMHGRIMAWALPEVLHSNRLVCSFGFLLFLHYLYIYIGGLS
jgi:hypothetical protein